MKNFYVEANSLLGTESLQAHFTLIEAPVGAGESSKLIPGLLELFPFALDGCILIFHVVSVLL